MNTNKSSSALKSLAKGQLLGNYSKIITAYVITEFFIFGIFYLADSTIDESNIFGVIIYYSITLLLQLFVGIFASGQARLYLNFCSNRPYFVKDIFYGFKVHPDKAIIIQLNRILNVVICFVPFVATYIVYHFTDYIILIPIMTLLLLIGIVICSILLLGLSQCFYIMQDFSDYSPKQVIAMSKKVMKGYQGKLFYLTVSFLPLLLLCLITFGLGLLWIMPYIYTVQANFYLDLMKCHSNNKALD